MSLARLVGVCVVAAVGAACGRAPAPAPARLEPAPAASPEVAVAEPPAHRLSDAALPRAYRLEVAVDPTSPSFAGTVEIDLELTAPASSVWLNADGLALVGATLTPANGTAFAVSQLAAPADRGLLGLSFGRTVAAGMATLRIEYTGAFRQDDGLFRQAYGWASYAFTDFEPIDARRAFPCFDDPRFKTPFDLALIIPSGARAFSNTDVASEQPAGDTRKRVAFATTPPLPTYLLAWAVGPFAVVEGARQPIPIRAITFPGTEARVTVALDAAAALLPLAQAYVDRPIPFAKLDLIAVPSFDGAMENPGLVTVAARILHVDPDDPAPRAERLLGLVIAHEIAHYWFGDLVTMRWWDDLWLNEGFATWMASRLLDTWKPAWHWPLEDRLQRSNALASDRGARARAIRTPITSDAHIRAGFDATTYLKGGAVLGMLEHWIGPEVFRAGVQAYLEAHAWGSADARDLVAALQTVSSKPIDRVLRDFTERAGAPDLTADVRCRGNVGELIVRQQSAEPWHVPMCARVDRTTEPVCALLSERETTVPLATCAVAAYPNWMEHSYVLARRYGPAHYLSPIERMGALEVVLADAEAGTSTGPAIRQALLALGPVASASEGRMIAYALDRLRTLRVLSAPDLQVVIERLLGARARALGFARRPGESQDDRLTRGAIVRVVGVDGADAALRRQAVKQLRVWLATGAGIDAESFADVAAIAASAGDVALFDAMIKGLGTDDLARRSDLAAALAYFDDPALIDRALALARGRTLSRSDAAYMLYRLAQVPHARDRVWAYLDQHRVELAAQRLVFSSFFDGGCSASDAAITERVLTAASVPADDLEETLTAIRACAALRRN